MIRISAVSYLNTYPFIYGLQQSELMNEFTITTDVPAICAQKLINNEVEIGLVPVAIIPQLRYHRIITDYCIGAIGKVHTVLLLSKIPLQEIKNIYLDNESRTSVKLVKVLARNYWKINPGWIDIPNSNTSKTDDFESVVLIGDKTFTARQNYPYVYDLAEEWQLFTGLPFVFACWVANKPLKEDFILKFNNIIKTGIENIDKVIDAFKDKIPDNVDAKEYYTRYISYNLDEDKKMGLDLFLKYLKV